MGLLYFGVQLYKSGVIIHHLLMLQLETAKEKNPSNSLILQTTNIIRKPCRNVETSSFLLQLVWA